MTTSRHLPVLTLCILIATGVSARADVKSGLSLMYQGDYANALTEFQASAKTGDVNAEYWLGHMYEQGLGIKPDAGQAVTWWTKAAQGGLTQAKRALGVLYLQGEGIFQDFDKAHKWLEEAANDGDAVAQRELGTLYAEGLGVNKDKIWAYVWYDFAARGYDREAARLREDLVKTMSSDDIAEAQKLAAKLAPTVFGAENGTSQVKQ
jgi:uncharacterized protein